MRTSVAGEKPLTISGVPVGSGRWKPHKVTKKSIREGKSKRKKLENELLREELDERKLRAALEYNAPLATPVTYAKAKHRAIDDGVGSVQKIAPQEGPQTDFLSCPADIVVYGGSAGGGKSMGLLLDPLRYVQHPRFGAVLFRRTFPEIKKEGGLWDEAVQLYLPLGARPRESDLSFTFPSGAVISFAHLQHEKNIYGWQGSQVPYLGFDELTHFTERQFWYLMSRQRNVAGIPNLCRCTCNPDPDSFVRELIDWWIDSRGFAKIERSGHIRWFFRQDNSIIWGNSKEYLIERYGAQTSPRSFTFIRSTLQDNRILMDKDPSYLATLESLPKVDRERLLSGNWNIRPAAGLYFKRTWFELIDRDAVPPLMKVCRGWDLAGTEKDKDKATKDPAATAGVKIGRDVHGNFYILDLRYDRVSPMAVERMIKNCSIQDGARCMIRLPQDPGQAGKAQVAHFSKLLMGYPFKTRIMSGDKVTRAGPFSSMCEYGRVKVVKASWNDLFFNHLEEFPPEAGSPDVVDAAVEAFHQLTSAGKNVKIIAPVSILI
jgi:predicted phage terminase large subunit-like protein